MSDGKGKEIKQEVKREKGKSQSKYKDLTPLEVNMLIRERMSKIKHKIVVMSGKGGVGKTTVAVNLAIKLASIGRTVGILDVDITGPDVPLMLNLEGRRPPVDAEKEEFRPVLGPLNMRVMSMAFLLQDNQTPVIWRGPLKMSAIRQFLYQAQWGELDYMVFDLPPGTSDETLDILQLIEDGYVIIVTQPQDVSLLDVRKAINMVKQMKRNLLGIIENMSILVTKCPKCNETIQIDLFGEGGGQKVAEEMGVRFLGKIPFEVDVRIGGDNGFPFIIDHPDAPSGKAFEEIVKKIIELLEKP
ncbi:MAG: Mrp/NBP35 family ATP-binding protein [Promethearchaeota archaeon]